MIRSKTGPSQFKKVGLIMMKMWNLSVPQISLFQALLLLQFDNHVKNSNSNVPMANKKCKISMNTKNFCHIV